MSHVEISDENTGSRCKYFLSGRQTHMVKKSGSDVVKVSKEGEEAASQLVVPNLVKTESE